MTQARQVLTLSLQLLLRLLCLFLDMQTTKQILSPSTLHDTSSNFAHKHITAQAHWQGDKQVALWQPHAASDKQHSFAEKHIASQAK